MSTTELIQQLSQLTEALKEVNALITRLSNLEFQPGSEPLESEDSVRVELAQDIHDSLKQIDDDLELLKQDAKDLTATSDSHRRSDSEKEREKARLSAQVARLAQDAKQARSTFRRAQLIAKRASEAAKQKERELVFASLQSAPDSDSAKGDSGRETPDLFAGRKRAQQKQLNKDEQLISASSDVTAALRRTHNLLSTELSRSRFAQETFDQSSAALAELGEHYSNLDTILSTSRNLLGTLLRSQKSDTWYLETAFYILITTLVWLIFRRLLFGPFIRLPLFLWRSSSFLLRWMVLKPLWLFLTFTGIITTEPISAAARSAAISQSTTSRPPLIVQNSATGGIPTFAMSDRERMQQGGGVPAGAGGAGAKVGQDSALQGHVSEQIAQMHQQSQDETQQQASDGKDLPKRGDGTVLQERGDIPRNPKKKMFEADVEDAKQAQRERDEL
ncbi:hypothetical protein BAUCODRAFT_519515 [Baudoinia panamericana UAMH 10762]|uniref:Sec20 C-terminal domain-containing protein n=1 Tax=Baudoinia panamericana (strain UAMH 10762) TaxID=717646 RepID=M2LKY0_BAUPA|nr:uncharacterized protein BAUCODRAFT_519515 [Baudoinia panamericana UAMH 10762]EMC94942.1 hypothetical protein BAUCODRAFT_519515 [Baudoinia panamericana UAMH 10762]